MLCYPIRLSLVPVSMVILLQHAAGGAADPDRTFVLLLVLFKGMHVHRFEPVQRELRA